METKEVIKKCVESACGKDFVITSGEVEFFKAKKFELPKRCKECRAKRKRQNDSPFGKVLKGMKD